MLKKIFLGKLGEYRIKKKNFYETQKKYFRKIKTPFYKVIYINEKVKKTLVVSLKKRTFFGVKK